MTNQRPVIEVVAGKPRTRHKKAPRRRVGRKKVSKVISISKLVTEADKWASLWVRKSNADKNGMVKSFTGNEVKHWTKVHNGHYLSRSIKALRWHEDNMRPQSPAENIWKHGNPIEFRINLVEEIGEERVKALESRRNELTKLTREYLQEIIEKYKQKLAYLTQVNDEL